MAAPSPSGIALPAATPSFADLGPALLKGLDLLWQYREGVGIVVGLILLVMIVDNLAAIHRELERLRRSIEVNATAQRSDGPSQNEDLMLSEGWRAD